MPPLGVSNSLKKFKNGLEMRNESILNKLKGILKFKLAQYLKANQN
jgi:hypothetical protein